MNIYGYVLLVNVISADLVRRQHLLFQQNAVVTYRRNNLRNFIILRDFE